MLTNSIGFIHLVSFGARSNIQKTYDVFNLCWDEPDRGGGTNWTELPSMDSLLKQYVHK